MRPLSRRLAPQSQNRQAAPPAAVGGRRQGTSPPPPSPPPPPAKELREAGRRDSGPAYPGGPRHPEGGTPRPRQARPHAKRPRWTARRPPRYQLSTDNGTAHPGRRKQRDPLGGRPGEDGGADQSEEITPPPPPPPPPAALTHWQPTGRRPTLTAARQPPQQEYAPRGRAGDKG